MLKNSLILTLFIGLSHSGFSQKVDVKSNIWGTKITHNEKLISVKEFVELTKTNQRAYNYALKAKKNKGAMDVFSTIGGFMMGWPIGAAIAGKEFQSELFIAGAGIACISIPFNTGMSKNLKNANKALSGSTTAYTTEYSFIANSNGMGVSISF